MFITSSPDVNVNSASECMSECLNSSLTSHKYIGHTKTEPLFKVS